MFKLSNYLVKSSLISHLKKYKSAVTFSFMIGLFIGSIPFIYKSKENFRIQKLIQEERKLEIQNREEICKNDNSDYKKFVSLGFPKTAVKKLYTCMKEQ